MKVIQLLLDGYNKSNNYPEIYSKSLFKDYQCESVDTKLSGQGRLSSPRMWGRTLYGPSFECKSSFNPNKSDKWNAQAQGYTDQLDQSLWIWNQLPDHVVKFAMPYYLVNEIEVPIVQSPNCTVITRDYKLPVMKHHTKDSVEVEPTFSHYNMICDIFDNNRLPKQLYNKSLDVWSKGKSEISKFIKDIYDFSVNMTKTELSVNLELLKQSNYPIVSNLDDCYLFVGMTDSDALYHYYRPYTDIFDIFRKHIDEYIQELLDYYEPDVFIIHGDHNMDDTARLHFRSRPKYEYTYNGIDGLCHVPYYNKYPMYSDHGMIVGGDIYYKSSVSDLVSMIPINDKSLIFTDMIREWLINSAFTSESR